MQIIAIVVSLAITAIAVGLAVRAVRSMLGVIRTGQPDGTRSDQRGRRLATMFKETLGHTRMLQWTWIGVMHWFVFAGFIFSHDSTIKPIGFGLAFGVLLDAFVVRMLLIPAAMHLLGDRAWWLPTWLDRILPDVDVEGAQLERSHPVAGAADQD